MKKDDWTRKLITKLASGHMNNSAMREASNWLQGKEPPKNWEPKAKKEYDKKK